MAEAAHGVGGLSFDARKRTWPNEVNVLLALILITLVFEVLNRLQGGSFLFNTRANVDTLFNEQRINIMLLQVAIIGVIALGVTQVIIVGGIDLSSGSIVGATAMIVMSFAQTATVNGNPNPKAIFGDWAMDLPVIVPIAVGLACGLAAGLVNGLLVAYTRIPPFIATLGMMVSARGVAKWWSNGQPVSFPTEGFASLANGDIVGGLTFGLLSWPGQNPAVVFAVLAILFHLIMKYTVYGKHCYAIGSNEDAARMSGINVARHKVLVYTIAGMLAAAAAVLLTSKNLTAQAGMGVMYELDAIAMAVIGGVSLAGGRGSIVGTVLGAMIFSVIISGFTSIRLDAYYQEMVKGAIIVGAVVLDQWRQRRKAARM
ncbi:MAG: ABC transporter permease [Rhodobacteraceae bacterium]|jgi:inositol transport system permease protein|nr:ABC transporter permease [Paracoccaceae bacterium]